MKKPTLNIEAVGSTLPWETIEWSPEEAQLYAVGVGAGQIDPNKELEFTTGDSRGVPQQVLPTFATILAHFKPKRWHTFGEYSSAALVHGEQSLRFFESIPPTGELRISETLSGYIQKPRGVLVTTHTVANSVDSESKVFESYASYYIMGASVERSRTVREDGLAEWLESSGGKTSSVSFQIPPNQALIYRFSGDFNPLHTDPAVAREGGFERPILHGLCTYGYAFRLLGQALSLSPKEMEQLDMRFIAPVYPGEILELEYWSTDDRTTCFLVSRKDGDPVARGSLKVTS